jgi:serine/threonine protein kinase
MPNLGSMNLQEKFEKENYHFSTKAIFKMAVQIFDALHQIHKADHVYCDLKLSNIIVEDDSSSNDPENYRLHLVDFGCA